MRTKIIAHLLTTPRAQASEIAQAIGRGPREVQEALHSLDDDGSVIMKAGWYSLSEAERIRIKKDGVALRQTPPS